MAQNICRQFIKMGHEVDIFSTNGREFFPEDLKPYLKGSVEENHNMDLNQLNEHANQFLKPEYDMSFSYTALKNAPFYLQRSKKNRFLIWCYEWEGKNVIPTGWAKQYKHCDFILAPSQFAKQVFIDSGIPENIVKVVSHGIDVEQFQKTSTMSLPTNKKYKILANIAQNHLRKNIPALLEAYGKAFSKTDDVCLVLKAKEKPIRQQFEISLNSCLNVFNRQFTNAAEVCVLSAFLPDIAELYRSCDALYASSYCEGFHFPSLEAIASGKIAIVPKYSGPLDFLNDNNSLLIEGKKERANPKSMYWEHKNNAMWFKMDIDDAVKKLRYSYQNYEEMNKKVEMMRGDVYKNYGWDKIAKDIIALCQ